jgi:formylglycine-generating enzyme required for sulfatase activity
MPSPIVVARIVRRSSVLALLLATPVAEAHTQATYTDSIPGTLVKFEMVSIAGTGNIAPFLIGRTEVTWDMYDAYWLQQTPRDIAGDADAVARPTQPYGAPDYGWGHAGFPVISVTRAAAEAFCEWLSLVTGRRYRLPTDAEWEHVAALALQGGRTPDDSLAWHADNSEGRTHAVSTLAPDALGLHDLFGNASEWVVAPGDSNVTRGGSFRTDPSGLGIRTRAVQHWSWNERDPQLPKSRWWLSDAPFVGFRLVREP